MRQTKTLWADKRKRTTFLVIYLQGDSTYKCPVNYPVKCPGSLCSPGRGRGGREVGQLLLLLDVVLQQLGYRLCHRHIDARIESIAW